MRPEPGVMPHEASVRRQWEPQTDAEHLEEMRGLPAPVIAHMKKRAQNSTFFMAKGIMGYSDTVPHVHGRFCKAIENEEDDRQLLLMPRGTMKSSVGTEADSVRIAVKDPDNARILIVNEVVENAVAFMDTITQQFEKNEFLRFLFPELVHDRFTGPGINWSQKSATLPRKTTWKEPTWMAMGVGGAVTSKHFSHIKADDLIGLEAKKSPAELKAAIAWNQNIESLAIDSYSTVIHWIGTRWGRNDLYAEIIDRYGDKAKGGDLSIFSRGAVEKGRIIFPEKYSWKQYRRIMDKTPDIWMAQYMNDPTSDMATDFQPGNLRTFRFNSEGYVVYKENGRECRWHWTELDRVITVDPNGGSRTAPDEAAIVVSGVAPDDKVFVLYCFTGRPTPTEFTDKIFQVAMRWRPRTVGIEKAGQQATRHLFEEKCKKEGISFIITDLKHRNQAKEDRIRTNLETPINSCLLYCLPSQNVLRGQIQNYPDVKNDDAIDALAYAAELWTRGVAREQQVANRAAVERILRRRSTTTGWGPVRAVR